MAAEPGYRSQLVCVVNVIFRRFLRGRRVKPVNCNWQIEGLGSGEIQP